MAERLRCAIYTRKSSEEGLEQDFNSLEAQREACEAYVRSQAHEGWTIITDRFDDGGFSGGNMERPALKALLDQIRDRKVDIIVVYKIDRLTRSLTDFARLAELLDAQKVSFVSVTQQFNTTTSMGRLMLNVLLSFAQFEREITGERIRDKIAASKKKGMWMGGVPPLGYVVRDRQLFVDETQAATVRRVFDLYLEAGAVPKLMDRLQSEGITTVQRHSAKGTAFGGKPFTRGHLYKLLSNPIYIGRVPHKTTSHRGQHQPIISADIWQQTQALLASNTQGPRRRQQRPERRIALLDGILFSETNTPMSPSQANKGSHRYRYYVEPLPAGSSLKAIRLPAREIEDAVVTGLRAVLADKRSIHARLDDIPAAQRLSFNAGLGRLVELLSGRRTQQHRATVRDLLHRVVYSHDRLALHLNTHALVELCLGSTIPSTLEQGSNTRDSETTYIVTVPLTYRRRGPQMKLAIPGQSETPPPDPSLVQAIVRAWDWADQLISGKVRSMAEICEAENVSDTYVGQILRLAFLPPPLIEAILAGTQDTSLTADWLIWEADIGLEWGTSPIAPIRTGNHR